MTKTNGAFDCVMKRSQDQYDFYECKYYDRPMTVEECTQELRQLAQMQGIDVSGVGFVCTGGFTFHDTNAILIDGTRLYDSDLTE